MSTDCVSRMIVPLDPELSEPRGIILLVEFQASMSISFFALLALCLQSSVHGRTSNSKTSLSTCASRKSRKNRTVWCFPDFPVNFLEKLRRFQAQIPRPRYVLANHFGLSLIGAIVPHPRFFPMQQVGKDNHIGNMSCRRCRRVNDLGLAVHAHVWSLTARDLNINRKAESPSFRA